MREVFWRDSSSSKIRCIKQVGLIGPRLTFVELFSYGPYNLCTGCFEIHFCDEFFFSKWKSIVEMKEQKTFLATKKSQQTKFDRMIQKKKERTSKQDQRTVDRCCPLHFQKQMGG